MKKAVKKKAAARPQKTTVAFTREYVYIIDTSLMPEPVKRHRLHVAIMGCGGKGKPDIVIDDGCVKEYVGIGWITLSEIATRADYLKYPMVID